ncbi:hypothetical protein FLM9_921, partial [Candidatus Synechococcus spongiarum]
MGERLHWAVESASRQPGGCLFLTVNLALI